MIRDVVTIEYNDILADRRCHDDRVRLACLRFLIDHGADRRPSRDGRNRAWRSRRCSSNRYRSARAAGAGTRGGGFGLRRPQSAEIVLRRLFWRRSSRRTARSIRRSLGALPRTRRTELEAAARCRRGARLLRAMRRTAPGPLDGPRPAGCVSPTRSTPPFIDGSSEPPFPLGKVELVQIKAANEPIGYLYNFLDRKTVSLLFQRLSL